jgi:hypothetical protein
MLYGTPTFRTPSKVAYHVLTQLEIMPHFRGAGEPRYGIVARRRLGRGAMAVGATDRLWGIADVVNVPDGWRHSRGNHLNDWSLLDLLHYHASFSVAGLFGPSGSDIFDAMPLRAASPC